MNPKVIVGSILSVIVLIIIVSIWPFTTISAGERGVVLHLGRVDRVLDEGFHVVTPAFEKVKVVDVSTQKEEVSVTAASKDLQTVSAKVAINFSVDPAHVGELWKQYNGEHADRVVAPSIQEAVKAGTAKYTAEELITKRENVKNDLSENLRNALASSGIFVENVFITDFDFSAQFNSAIEAKVTAEQSALASKNKLEQIKFEAQQTIETAKAQAESIRIQAQAITSQGGADYVQLQAIKQWKGDVPQYMMSGATVPFINLPTFK